MTKYEAFPAQPETVQPYYPSDEIDIRELFTTLWRGKWIVMATTILFAVAGVSYALSKPNIYQASVLLATVQDEGGAGRLSGQLGGLASLAGISLGGGGTNKTVMAKQVLESRAFLSDFIHRHNLVVPLMATEAWSMERQEWVINREAYSPETGAWLQDEEGKSLKPTDWDLVKQFKANHLSITEDKQTGMYSLNIKSQSPPVAKEWAEKLAHDINEHMRQQDVKEAEARIAYLEEKLNQTNIAGMQQVFYQLIENETRTVMLANAQNEYIFETVDPAVVPQDKSEPNRTLITIVVGMLGSLIGVFSVFMLNFMRSEKSKSNE